MLANGFKYEMTEEKGDAYFTTFGHLNHAIWKETVRQALLSPRFPALDHLLDICERVSQAARDKARHVDDRAAKNFFAGKTQLVNRNPADQAYGEFRFMVLRMALKSGEQFAETMLNYLWGWLESPKNQAYARQAGVLDTILGEIDYYEIKAAAGNPNHTPQPTANTAVEIEVLEDAI